MQFADPRLFRVWNCGKAGRVNKHSRAAKSVVFYDCFFPTDLLTIFVPQDQQIGEFSFVDFSDTQMIIKKFFGNGDRYLSKHHLDKQVRMFYSHLHNCVKENVNADSCCKQPK